MNKVEPGAQKTIPVAVVALVRKPSASEPCSGLQNDNTVPELADFFSPQAEVLITLRMGDSPYAGWWEFPGGKIDPGEHPEQGGARECKEELGVDIEILKPLDTITHTYEHARVQIHPFIAKLSENSPPLQNIEVADHRWVPLAQMPVDKFLPANGPLIEQLKQLLIP